MTEWAYPTAFCGWGPEEREAFNRVVARGQFTQGPEVEALESELAEANGRDYCVVVNSGSSANLIAVSALRHLGMIKEGQAAIVPAVAWATTYAPLVQHGLDLMLADCDGSWNADPWSDLWTRRAAAGDYPKLVVFVPILGNPSGVGMWEQIADVNEVPLLVDGCESAGAVIGNHSILAYGTIATTSFFWSHQISAIEGGAILTDDAEIDRACRVLRAHGWLRDVKGPGDHVPFDREYSFVAFGYNVRGLELHAAVAREQLKKLPAMLERRRENDRLFRSLTSNLPIDHPDQAGEQSPFCLPFMLLRMRQDRRETLANALRLNGIDCRMPTGGSFTRHPYGEHWRDQATPRADDLHSRGMFLGNGPLDLTEQITRAVEIMREVLL